MLSLFHICWQNECSNLTLRTICHEIVITDLHPGQLPPYLLSLLVHQLHRNSDITLLYLQERLISLTQDLKLPWAINTFRSSWVISHIVTELKTKISKTCSPSIIMINVQRSSKLLVSMTPVLLCYVRAVQMENSQVVWSSLPPHTWFHAAKPWNCGPLCSAAYLTMPGQNSGSIQKITCSELTVPLVTPPRWSPQRTDVRIPSRTIRKSTGHKMTQHSCGFIKNKNIPF